MAIFYIDPHTTVNGTGTWASPWSLTSTVRTGLASGDEIRIKGVPLNVMFTATTYTVTITNNYQITITAGGSLAADFPAGSIAYFPEWDAFFRVYASNTTTNVISCYTSQVLWPIYDSTKLGASVTLRKVNTTSFPVGSSQGYNIGGGAALSSLTVTDCWLSETNRVTDGSVKSLFTTSATTTVSFIPATSSTAAASNYTVDLSNTHVMCGSGNTTGIVATYIYASNSTITVNQINSQYYSSGGIILGQPTLPIQNTTVTVNKFDNTSTINTAYCSNCTVNIEQYNIIYYDYIVNASGNNQHNAHNLTINYGTIVHTNWFNSNALVAVQGATGLNINFNGMIDATTATAASVILSGFGNINITFGAGFSYNLNKRAAPKTSFTNKGTYQSTLFDGSRVVVPTIPTPSGFTLSSNAYSYTTIANYQTQNRSIYQRRTLHVDAPSFSEMASNTPSGYYSGTNVLVTYRDGSAPREILSIAGSGYYASGNSSSNFPVVTTDASTYRTTGPSLRALLTSRLSAAWANKPEAIKTIKIPAVAGVSRTVTGYVRNTVPSFANGDLRMSIVLGDTLITYQDMTTASNNAWEQFTLTFTPSITGEYSLLWEMYYAGSGSMWLDDLSIT